MVAKLAKSVGEKKEGINSALLLIIAALLTYLTYSSEQHWSKLDKAIAWINAQKGMKGDKDLISRTKQSHVFLVAKKENIYDFEESVTN